MFICTNQREGEKTCCAKDGAVDLLHYAKTRIKDLRLAGKGKIRVNGSGCMDRCTEGPVLVVYPDGIWYRYKTQADIDEIIECHVLQGQIVERLLLPEG